MTMFKKVTKTFQWGQHKVTMETGEIARQSSGAVLLDILGKEFITVYTEIKELEFEEFMKVISPWEREHLLLHV